MSKAADLTISRTPTQHLSFTGDGAGNFWVRYAKNRTKEPMEFGYDPAFDPAAPARNATRVMQGWIATTDKVVGNGDYGKLAEVMIEAAYDQVEGAVEDILRANGFKVQRARAILRFDCKVWERRDRKFGKVVVDMTKGMAIGRVTRSNEWTGKSRLIIATYPKDDFGQASIWPKPMAAEPYRQTLHMGLCAVRAMQLI